MRQIEREKLRPFLEKYFPEESVFYIIQYFEKYSFNFSVSRPRLTKKGDFRFRYDKKGFPTISVNGDLIKYEFLLVFIHELAHFFVYEEETFHEEKHGERWKTIYRSLLTELMVAVPLPQDIVDAWTLHLQQVKSTSSTDEHLLKVFKKYGSVAQNSFLLKELAVGEYFIFQNQKFRLDKFRRTQAICTLIRTNRPCLISMVAEVIKHELPK